MAEHSSLIRSHYAALNGLRGVAILMVFFVHYGSLFADPKWTWWLWVGVDLFFVLSGFLITGILYDSKDQPRYFRNFYLRRTLRIFPLYYGFFLLLLLLKPLLHISVDHLFWSNLLYLEDFTRFPPFVGAVTTFSFFLFHRTIFIGLGVLWSLCVEEQFYLVWPLMIRLLRSRLTMMRFCCFAIVATLCLRCALLLHNPGKAAATHYLYYSPYTRCDSLLIGALLALWLRGTQQANRAFRHIAYWLITVGAGSFALGMITLGRRWPLNESNPICSSYGYTSVAVAAAGILILALEENSAVHRVLRSPRLAVLGTVSYGFYFFHEMLRENLLSGRHIKSRHAGLLASALIFLATYILAWLSFRYFESPFLRLKIRLAPTHRSVPSGLEDVSPEELMSSSLPSTLSDPS